MFGDPELQSAALDYLLTDKITASDIRYALAGHFHTEKRAARTRGWLYRNYDELTRKMPPFTVPSMPQYLGGGCDPQVLKVAYDFFMPRLEAMPAYARTLEKTAESVRQCAALRARESKALAAYLDDKNAPG
jgi:alanyl aminopeptidase